MPEAVAATFWFWMAFQFSVGPWWIAYMETAKNAPFSWLARNIGVYIFVGWMPFVAAAAGIARILGGIHPAVLAGLHFFGGFFMLYLAYKIITAAKAGGAAARLNFDWKAMTVLVWSNPKAWLAIPAGSLAATYADSEVFNIAVFVLMSVPVYLAAAFLWAAAAKQGAKLAGDKRMGYANAFLLAGFALYLLRQGGALAAG